MSTQTTCRKRNQISPSETPSISIAIPSPSTTLDVEIEQDFDGDCDNKQKLEQQFCRKKFKYFAFLLNLGNSILCLPLRMDKDNGKLEATTSVKKLIAWKVAVILSFLKIIYHCFQLVRAHFGLSALPFAALNIMVTQITLSGMAFLGHFTFYQDLDAVVYFFNQFLANESAHQCKPEVDSKNRFYRAWCEFNLLIKTILASIAITNFLPLYLHFAEPELPCFTYSVLPLAWRNDWTWVLTVLFDSYASLAVWVTSSANLSIMVAYIMITTRGLQMIRSDVNISAYQRYKIVNSLFTNCYSKVVLPVLSLLTLVITVCLVFTLIRSFFVIPFVAYIYTFALFVGNTSFSYTAHVYGGYLYESTVGVLTSPKEQMDLMDLHRLRSCRPFGLQIGTFYIFRGSTSLSVFQITAEYTVNLLLYKPEF